jgi:hypothetical protein
MGILLMVIFGITGIIATALAWFCPALHLDKTTATLAGIIGTGFAVYQGLSFRHPCHVEAEPISVEVATEEKP